MVISSHWCTDGNPYENPSWVLPTNWQVDSQIYMELQGPKIAKTNLKKNKAGEFTFSDFKTMSKATVTKALWHWHMDRHID